MSGWAIKSVEVEAGGVMVTIEHPAPLGTQGDHEVVVGDPGERSRFFTADDFAALTSRPLASLDLRELPDIVRAKP